MDKTEKKAGHLLVFEGPAVRGHADGAVIELFRTRMEQRADGARAPSQRHFKAGSRVEPGASGLAPGAASGLASDDERPAQIQRPGGIRDWEDAGGEWDPLGPGSGGWRA